MSGGFAGKSNVVEIENVHSNGAIKDTTYIYQESGNVYRYNYGLEGLNSVIANVLGKPVSPGWVIQAKLDAASGTSWKGIDTSVYVLYNGANLEVKITDNAVEGSDETFIVNGRSMMTKHSVHSVTATLVALSKQIAAITIDNYVTVEEGTVLNIAHSFEFTAPTPYPSTGVAGQYTVMTSFR